MFSETYDSVVSHDEQAEAAEDIGGGHRISYYVVHADNHLEAGPLLTATLDVDGLIVAGIIDWHRNPAGDWCGGAVNFVQIDGRAMWAVESLDPLTLSPSILCAPDKGGCGEHGFIREGRWVTA